MELDRRDYLGDGGTATMVVDGICNTEVQRGFECHGLDVAKGGVPELQLGVEQRLVSACGESHSLLCEDISSIYVSLCRHGMPAGDRSQSLITHERYDGWNYYIAANQQGPTAYWIRILHLVRVDMN